MQLPNKYFSPAFDSDHSVNGRTRNQRSAKGMSPPQPNGVAFVFL